MSTMTLSTEQQNGKEFMSFVRVIKQVSEDVKKHPECNAVICYADIDDTDNELLHNAEVKSSMMLSMMVGKVCIFHFSRPSEEHPEGEVILYHDSNIKDAKLVMRDNGKVGVEDEPERE